MDSFFAGTGRGIRAWWDDTAGVAIAEFALIFPLLMVLLMGVFEIGNAVAVNQKAISASQIVADLVARDTSVDDAALEEAIRAGELAILPYDVASMGVDIVSLQYDVNDNPEIVWRETRNMEAYEPAVTRAAALGREGDGVIVVTVGYNYRLGLGGFIVDAINMRETAYGRGRRTAVVARN